jgi:hypothetical protein
MLGACPIWTGPFDFLGNSKIPLRDKALVLYPNDLPRIFIILLKN